MIWWQSLLPAYLSLQNTYLLKKSKKTTFFKFKRKRYIFNHLGTICANRMVFNFMKAKTFVTKFFTLLFLFLWTSIKCDCKRITNKCADCRMAFLFLYCICLRHHSDSIIFDDVNSKFGPSRRFYYWTIWHWIDMKNKSRTYLRQTFTVELHKIQSFNPIIKENCIFYES